MLRKWHVPSPTLSVREVLGALARPMGVERGEAACARLTGQPHAVLFASARGALAASAACIAGDREVTLPAYTCIAVPNAMRSAGVAYGFVDVAADGTVGADGWERAGAAVALVQDTYGFSAAVPDGVPVIRDSAHRTDLLAAEGVDVAVTSFEHSKWLSAGGGGLAVTADADLAARMRRWRDDHGAPAGRVRHGLATLALLLLGRVLAAGGSLRVAGWLEMAGTLLARDAVAGQSLDERRAQGVSRELIGAPDGTSATLMVGQLRRVGAVADHRSRIAAIYDAAAGVSREPIPVVRYPMLVADPAAFQRAFADAGWDAEGRWFDAPLHPGAADPEAFGYRYGSAPSAEALARQIVNLPTHPLISDADARELIALAVANGARPLTRA